MENKYENNLEIIDTETYQPEEQQQFSHQQLIMKAMNKVIEAGCKELRSGYWNEKQDKFGNITRTYIEDTRKVFIESVETLEMFMDCDLDEEAKEEIKTLKNNLKETFKELLVQEKKDWDKLSNLIKINRIKEGIIPREKGLHPELHYAEEFIEARVKMNKEIVKSLTKLTKRLNFYKEEALAL
jgi:hypothetical protein